MSDLNDAQLADFCEKIKHFRERKLTAEQLPLFDQILNIAWNAAPPEGPLAEFDGCFEPGQAAMILSYSTASGPAEMMSWMVEGMVKSMVKHLHTP